MVIAREAVSASSGSQVNKVGKVPLFLSEVS